MPTLLLKMIHLSKQCKAKSWITDCKLKKRRSKIMHPLILDSTGEHYYLMHQHISFLEHSTKRSFSLLHTLLVPPEKWAKVIKTGMICLKAKSNQSDTIRETH